MVNCSFVPSSSWLCPRPLVILITYSFLTISNFSECLYTCLHFEYSLQETHPQTSSLTDILPQKTPSRSFSELSSAKCARSLGLKKFFTGIIENYIGLCISTSLTSTIPVLEIWLGIFPINSLFQDPTKDSRNCQLCYTSGQTPIKRKKKKKQQKNPPHSHSGLSTKPPFNFLVPLSRQFRTAKGLKIHWGQEDHTANFYPFLPQRMV